MKFKKESIVKVVEEILDNKNEDVAAHIMYDTSDGDVWVDFLLTGEFKKYESESIHEIEWADFTYNTVNITGPFVKINVEALEYYFVNRLEYELD